LLAQVTVHVRGTWGTTALSTFCAIAFAYCSTNERASARVAPLPFAPPSTICPTPLGRAFGASLNDLSVATNVEFEAKFENGLISIQYEIKPCSHVVAQVLKQAFSTGLDWV
jgi:hypothetical protein